MEKSPREIQKMSLPTLQGSEKQIARASEIREDVLLRFFPEMEDEREEQALIDITNKHKVASWWIEKDCLAYGERWAAWRSFIDEEFWPMMAERFPDEYEI